MNQKIIQFLANQIMTEAVPIEQENTMDNLQVAVKDNFTWNEYGVCIMMWENYVEQTIEYIKNEIKITATEDMLSRIKGNENEMVRSNI